MTIVNIVRFNTIIKNQRVLGENKPHKHTIASVSTTLIAFVYDVMASFLNQYPSPFHRI